MNQEATASDSPIEHVPVLIVGGGPVGLTLARELHRLGVEFQLIERNPHTTRRPKMDITNGRSMEFYRRLGIAEALRKVAVPGDHPMRVTWVTNAAGWQLASFDYPCVDEVRETIAFAGDGSTAIEPSMRVSQVVLEPALRDLLLDRVSADRDGYGWMLDTFQQDSDGVTAQLLREADGSRRTVRAEYLIGCDGGGSRTRRGLGIGLDEMKLPQLMVKELGLRRVLGTVLRNMRHLGQRPPDGRFSMVHFSTTDRRISERFGQMWHLQSPEGWSVISQDDGDIWTIHVPLGIGEDADAIDPRELVQDRLGLRFDMDIHVANPWTPRLSVADRFGHGRVWLAGDAVHQVTPTGGYGMNTGVGDAVGLAWALTAILQGWGTPGLLKAYEHERRSVAIRNRSAAARHSVIRGAIMSLYRPAMHSEELRAVPYTDNGRPHGSRPESQPS